MWCIIVSKFTYKVIGPFDNEDSAFEYARRNYIKGTFLIREFFNPD